MVDKEYVCPKDDRINYNILYSFNAVSLANVATWPPEEDKIRFAYLSCFWISQDKCFQWPWLVYMKNKLIS